MYIGRHVKYPVFLSDFNESCDFATDFPKLLKYQIFMKIPSVAAEFFHAHWRTDMTKLIVAFRNFANVPKTQ